MNSVIKRKLLKNFPFRFTNTRQMHVVIDGKNTVLPTQFLVNSARVCVRMPVMGDTWFFIENSTTTSEFKKLCQQEDNKIENIDILEEKGALGADVNLYNLLEQKKALYLRINNTTYQFDTQLETNCISIKETEKFYNKCLQSNLPYISANTIAMISNNLLKSIESDKKILKSELTQKFIQEASFFEQSIVREQIYRLQSLKLIVRTELKQLEARLSQIQQIEYKKQRRVFAAMSLWFTAQFAISGYCIYFVPWLGWDLFEPMTYTVTQGSCILGLIYIFRNRGVGVEYSQLSEYWQQKRQQKLFEKYGIDIFYVTELQKLDRQIGEELKNLDKEWLD